MIYKPEVCLFHYIITTEGNLKKMKVVDLRKLA